MCLPPHQRQAKGVKMSLHLLHLIGSGVHSSGHEKGQRVILLILCLFMRFIEMEKDLASSACKWLIFYRILKRD
jgi:hypothetical protein